MTRFLRRAGHAVRSVPNGREALAELAAETPDIMLLDYKMPESRVDELLKRE